MDGTVVRAAATTLLGGGGFGGVGTAGGGRCYCFRHGDGVGAVSEPWSELSYDATIILAATILM